MMLWKYCTQHASKLGKLSRDTRTGQISFIPIPKEGNAKNVQTTVHLHSFPMLARKCSKSFKTGLSIMWTDNFQMYKLDLEKAEEPEIKLPTSSGLSKSERVPEEHLFLLYWLHQNLWLCGSQQSLENSERDWNTRPPDLPPEKSACRSRSNS